MTKNQTTNPMIINGPQPAKTRTSWYRIVNGPIPELHIYDEIGYWGIRASDVVTEIKALGNPDKIKVHLSSPGGSVWDGVAIYNLLSSLDAEITIVIDSVAASIASIIAMAGKVIFNNGSLMMIHNPAGGVYGESYDLRKQAERLDLIRDQLADIYHRKTGLDNETLIDMMNEETWMDGATAIELGFAESVDNSTNIIASFDPQKLEGFTNMPTSFYENYSNQFKQQSLLVAGPEPKDKPTDPDDKDPSDNHHREKFQKQETQRRSDIRNAFKPFGNGHDDLLNTCLDDLSCTVDDAKNHLLNKLGKESKPISTNSPDRPTHIHADNGNFVKDHFTNSLAARAGIEEIEPDNMYGTGYTLLEIARACLTEKNFSGWSGDKREVVASAFTHSSSDFPLILEDVSRKSMLRGYDEAEETFLTWVNIGTLTDFKPTKRIDLNSFPELLEMPEGAEYQFATMGERGVTVQLASYGRLFGITRQAIINDDVSVFTRIPQRMGRAAPRTVGNMVYAVLQNGSFEDGKKIFHASHKNIADSAPMSVDSIDAADVKLGTMEDGEGNTLNISTGFIIVPRAKRSRAHILMTSTSDPDGPHSNTKNGVSGLAEVVSDARLDKMSKTAWYQVAGKQFDTIEVSYLDGNDKPRMESKNGWDRDGVEYKIGLDAAVAALDYKTMVKNEGVDISGM